MDGRTNVHAEGGIRRKRDETTSRRRRKVYRRMDWLLDARWMKRDEGIEQKVEDEER
jgi:hypothetical protein